jgi:hypothetical protein
MTATALADPRSGEDATVDSDESVVLDPGARSTDSPTGPSVPTAAATTPDAQAPEAVSDTHAPDAMPAVLAPRHFFMRVILATTLVAICPTVVVWWLRSSGVLSSYPLGAALGMALSLGAAYGGRAFWQKRPSSRDILFGDLLVWGYALRLYRERRLRSARATLGLTSQAQLRMVGGLSAERQVRRLELLARALDSRDPATQGHSRRVARYSWTIASRMGLSPDEVARVRTAAAVHDLGKLRTPLSILRKPGALTDEEYEVMKRHAADGARIASALHDPGITAMVRHHHERLDGSGYPDRLAGEQIPVGARIIAVADTFDAMTADRPYRAGRAHEEALEVLVAEAGTKLDAAAVRAFCNHYSGRRSVALFSTLTTVPSRLASMLGSGAGGVASAAKAAAVAALLGNLAAGTARLAPSSHSSKSHVPALALARDASSPAVKSAATYAAGTALLLARSEHQSSSAARLPTRGHAAPLSAASRVTTSSPVAGAATPSSTSSVSSVAAGGSSTTAASDESIARNKTPNEAGKSEEASKGKSEEAHTKSEASSKTEASEGKSEEAHTKSEASSKTEASKGKSEEAKGKSEESHGKSEESHGKSEGVSVTGKVEEKLKETVAKVEETTKKVEETTKGTVEETTSKLKKVLGGL